jgi:diguanylate cyclase (GGDEF)-like protein
MTQSGLQAAAPKKLPADIHAALVETLFGTVGSFVSGIFGGMLVPVIAAAKTHDPLFVLCTAIVFALSVLRLGILLAWRRASVENRMARASWWEKIYSVGAVGFMTAVGITAALLFHRHMDEVTPLYGVVIVLACAGALAGRNAGRPLIVYGQVVGVLGPMTAILLLEYSPWYWGLAAIMGLAMASVKSTTKFLNGIIVQALMNGREARIQRGRFSSALDSMSHGLVMGDVGGEITVANHRLREFFGLSGDSVGLTIATLAERIAQAGRMSRADQANFTAAWEAHIAKRDAGVFTQAIDGRIFDFRCEPMEMGGFVVVVEDVTTARLASREIERMAHFDVLTGLPNRLQFHTKLVAALRTKPKAGFQTALLSVDLDQFKEVNDTRGHPTGDELLCLVARRLRQCVHGADLVARFGGDEFQVLVQAPDDGHTVNTIAQRIIDTLSASYTIDGNLITIGASIGIATSPKHASDADEMLRCADMALYRAKAEGRGVYRTFETEMDTTMRRKREVEHHLREAITYEELELHYQPVVDCRTGKIVAVEALARLRHPTEGLISPAEFIQVAEETGLIVRLGSWVLRRACRDAMAWPEHIRVAVNFSAKQFVMGHNVAADIRDALKEIGLAPSRLEVEITESTIFEAKDALNQLKEISASGVKLSLDDFGTGYSSLSYLRQFPVDKIKIDRSFAIDITSRESQAVIGSVSVLAQLLNVELVIEGIEELGQIEAIKPWNVRLVQGYVFSRPVPLAQLLPIVSNPAPFAIPKVKKVA